MITKLDLSKNFSGGNLSKIEIVPVRVKDVILDDSHEEYTKYGSVNSIGVIKYALLDSAQEVETTTTLPEAYPISTFTNTFPLRDEVVFLIRGPKKDLSGPENDKFFEKADYYLPSLSIFNDVNYIPYDPPEGYTGNKTDPGFTDSNLFKEDTGIRPLYPYNGDTIIQGRLGQSIRFTGTKSIKNTLTDDSNNGKPLTIISNGHEQESISTLYVENINRDLSSIYLTSDHSVPLSQAKLKYAGAKERPTNSNTFKGSQIVVNSGRLFFNSHSEDIQFTSTTDFGVSATNLYLDSENYIGLDSTKIYLGEKAKQFELQPVILGNQLEVFLQILVSALERTGKAMRDAKTIDGKIIPILNLEGTILNQTTKELLNQINPGGKSILKSEKVFTE